MSAWSPQQISERLKLEFPDDPGMRISHEAIYQSLFVQTRGALKRELVGCLRTGRALRVPRARARAKAWAHVSEEVMISSRPAEAEDRAVNNKFASPASCPPPAGVVVEMGDPPTGRGQLASLPKPEGTQFSQDPTS